MAVTKYIEDGREYWRVYLDLRSRRNPRIRVQKRLNRIGTQDEAVSAEKRLIKELTRRVAVLESKGLTWEELFERWLSYQELYPSRQLAETTLMDYAAALRNWTKMWFNRPAAEINRGDGRELITFLIESGKSASFRKNVKYIINGVYTWGIEEKILSGINTSPMQGLDIEKDCGEKVPEILRVDQIRLLLQRAKEQSHEWYPIWTAAVFTGCRNGELFALQVSDCDVISRDLADRELAKPMGKRHFGSIQVKKGWNTRLKKITPTKAGYWRTVPVSSEFYFFLVDELKILERPKTEWLLPRFWEWGKGEQARVLRSFCEGNGLPSVRFHALRACFATQLISSGVPPSVVMKICGWRDLKTMQIYIRLAGIDERGATESLRLIPNAAAAMEEAGAMYGGGRSD